MPKQPPVHELDFLKLSINHGELTRKLSSLGCPAPDIHEYAQHVCESWFHLGQDHLAEGQVLLAAGCRRATYSRAYYAAYNASKSARYLVQGSVSLKGDDHGKASTDLPSDFPDVINWSETISKLYEHRLRADYDNWSTTRAEFVFTPQDAINHADAFIKEVRNYINNKFGMKL